MKHIYLSITLVVWFVMLAVQESIAQDVSITVKANQNKQKVSPYIYGKNDSFEEESAQFYKDAGVRFGRMNQGNNATKYNWRRKISSHPDWYNNVYANDWDAKSLKVAAEHPDMQVMWAFQLLGRVASSKDYNFNDWEYNESQYWKGVNQNLAGGGVPNSNDPEGKALVEGDIDLYTMEWPADSTVEILNHWFGVNGLGLDKTQFAYWSMDNEADIWGGTHDDVMPNGQIAADDFIKNYIEVAKKARALYPDIKICGPVTTSEWQWFKWGEESLSISGRYYCFLEYFIKKLADEEKSSGIRLLDVFDLHNYPYAANDQQALQNHRIYYDKGFDYPGANGIKTINGGWDQTQTKEYIFTRINDWLDEHYGENHGIKLGLSEWAPTANEPNVCAVVYASILGTFADNGVDFFTPWTWETGMWETLHLFSRYSKEYSVASVSSMNNTVSAYTTINEAADSMTIMIVNRDMSNNQNVSLSIEGFEVPNGGFNTLQLANLPASETFVSHTNNALQRDVVGISSNALSVQVPPLSTTAVLISKTPLPITSVHNSSLTNGVKIYPNPAANKLTVTFNGRTTEPCLMNIYDQSGRIVQAEQLAISGQSQTHIDVSMLPAGLYLLYMTNKEINVRSRFVVKK